MKKLLLSLLIGSCAIAQDTDSAIANNPRNTLITAIARNDFGTTLKALADIPDMTAEEKQQYLQMADQIIFSSMMWHSNHYIQPEIGRNLLNSAGYFFATVVNACIATLALGVMVETAAHRQPDATPAAVISAAFFALAGYCGYHSINEFIKAWQKPSNRLENALRIRDALFHHNTSVVTLYMNTCGSYSTAVGSAALSYELPQNPEPISYNTIGYQSYALGCSALNEQTEQTEE